MPATQRPLPARPAFTDAERIARATAFADHLGERRTVRHFSDRPVPRAVIEQCLRSAGSAPSGANQQPWHFVAVADPALKRLIRAAAEEEERAFYQTAPVEWLAALEPLGTTADKPFLEIAPWVVAVFAQRWGTEPDGTRRSHYYVSESVGIATGFLLAALHDAGLSTLTHTPSPMGFLTRVLERPANEKPIMLVVAGHAADDATVPDIGRKPLHAIATFR
ncbi:MAG: nitroreductase family protein [Gemmatimonadaceae bacterium]|nr:nitroreductase family protein [Gemmatimonadaceae bacterium]